MFLISDDCGREVEEYHDGKRNSQEGIFLFDIDWAALS